MVAARTPAFPSPQAWAPGRSDGVHYSDLFEQYLPIADKPRRLLADWLPEFFFKTADGTWRPPANDEERAQKAALRSPAACATSSASPTPCSKAFRPPSATAPPTSLRRRLDPPVPPRRAVRAGPRDLRERRRSLSPSGRGAGGRGGGGVPGVCEEERVKPAFGYLR